MQYSQNYAIKEKIVKTYIWMNQKIFVCRAKNLQTRKSRKIKVSKSFEFFILSENHEKKNIYIAVKESITIIM